MIRLPPLPQPKENLLSIVSNIADDAKLTALAESYGLAINKISWEDTSRYKGSFYGDNISDQTLCVTGESMTLMPMIRRPNYADITADINIDAFTLVVGNENGSLLKKVSLKEYLQNIGKYIGNFVMKTMYLPRDEFILTSAQFCILPLRGGEVNFGVKLFNYQYSDDPAIMVIVASHEGTSTQVITQNNQVLYFNKNGKAHDFSAKRLSSDREAKGLPTSGEMTQEEQERNCLIILHVPLLVRTVRPRYLVQSKAKASMAKASMAIMEKASMKEKKEGDLGLEDAVLSVGNEHGTFIGTKDSRGQYLKLERDPGKPIRCTLQYYTVTDSPEIKESVFKYMSHKIDQVYASGSATGSLVLSNTTRTTETTTPGGPMFSGLGSKGGTLMPKD
jgi:hypothetical protein